eukprot:3840707-Rhodomonas_salina.1
MVPQAGFKAFSVARDYPGTRPVASQLERHNRRLRSAPAQIRSGKSHWHWQASAGDDSVYPGQSIPLFSTPTDDDVNSQTVAHSSESVKI